MCHLNKKSILEYLLDQKKSIDVLFLPHFKVSVSDTLIHNPVYNYNLIIGND